MRQKTAPYGFTLIEIIAGISVMAIIALGAAQFNFNRLSQNQKVEVEAVKIINIFEEARDNALIGRAVLSGADLNTPESWDITISTTGGGNIISIYTNEDSSTGSHATWSSPDTFSIQNIECQQLDGGTGSISGDPLIQFIGSSGYIASGCPDSSYKIISFQYGVGSLLKDISINVLTGVIENN